MTAVFCYDIISTRNRKENSTEMPKKYGARSQTTTKKVKIVGHQEYINPNTGELEDFQVVSMEDRDFDFHKIWLGHIINSLDLIGNQKTRLAFWILDHLDRENKLTMTYRQISEKTGISLDTVSKTMKSLTESNFLQRINQGAYRINPDMDFKGSRKARLNVLYQYNQTATDNKATNQEDEKEND